MGWKEDVEAFGLDTDVDQELGDDFQMALTPAGPFVPVKGFVNPGELQTEGIAIDPLEDDGPDRLLISKTLLLTPSTQNRFIVPELSPTQRWRPENWTNARSRRYWLIDLQKAST